VLADALIFPNHQVGTLLLARTLFLVVRGLTKSGCCHCYSQKVVDMLMEFIGGHGKCNVQKAIRFEEVECLCQNAQRLTYESQNASSQPSITFFHVKVMVTAIVRSWEK
jgi:hypothetical protein